jgi:multiple antibiotic resistance protein
MNDILQAFITLFVIMDPFGNLPIFISLTKGLPLREIRSNYNRSIVVAGLLLFAFLFFGPMMFELFGIDINSFKIAGGIILLIIGIFYVIGLGNRVLRSTSHDLVVPIGVPLLTGPGVITTTIMIVNENGVYVATIAALLTLIASWLIMMCAQPLYKVLGIHWTTIISRVMGILLAAIAVDFIVEAILSIRSTL